MRLRKTYITEDETTTTTGTKEYDLDFTDPVRAIYLGFYGKRYNMEDTNNPLLLRDIDKIEVVDGSDVIFSADGTRTGANQLYHTGKRPFINATANQYGACTNQVKISFGRDDSDDEYGFDPTEFTNPKLKVTHSYTEGSTGQWAAGTQKLTVQALVAEGAPKPTKFLMTKDIYTWSKASSGDETIDLPRDYPYRYIIFQTKDCTVPVYAGITKVKLSCNFDEFVPFEETTEDLTWDNINKYDMQWVQYEAIGDGTEEDIKAYCQMAWNWGCNVSSWNIGDDAMEKRPYSGYSTIGRRVTGTGSGEPFTSTYLKDAQRAICTFHGWELFDTEVIPFGNLQDPEEWFNPVDWKSVRLILTQAHEAAIASAITIQQVREY